MIHSQKYSVQGSYQCKKPAVHFGYIVQERKKASYDTQGKKKLANHNNRLTIWRKKNRQTKNKATKPYLTLQL